MPIQVNRWRNKGHKNGIMFSEINPCRFSKEDITNGLCVLNGQQKSIKLGNSKKTCSIKEGYKTFELRTLRIANKENNYGL